MNLIFSYHCPTINTLKVLTKVHGKKTEQEELIFHVMLFFFLNKNNQTFKTAELILALSE